ncbi:MAG: right-handed parallel beta-helix repeat-containing protein [Acidobacteria bacterium]|nr:right-handed parallel beta-helix repeat-containing protein [Acidobacteriota bacterium]
MGTADSVITFTALSGSSDGWKGIYFADGSDSYGSTSILEHCVVEKGGQPAWNGWEGNIFCYRTSQPTIVDSRIAHAGGNGIYCNTASPTITDCVIDSNTSTGIHCTSSNPRISRNTIFDNGGRGIACTGGSTPLVDSNDVYSDTIGIYCDGSSPTIQVNTIHDNASYGVYLVGNSCPQLRFNTYLNNGYNIAVGGGVISSDGTWYNDGGEPYVVLADVWVSGSGTPTLTIAPGVRVKFAGGAGLRIGNWSWPPKQAALYAVGTPDSQIVFTSLSGASNDWDGILFDRYSDYGGATSTMAHCVVEKAGQVGWGVSANVYCRQTTQPTLRDSRITASGGSGLYLDDGDITVVDCVIDSNATHGIYADNGSGVTVDSCRLTDNGIHGLRTVNSSPVLRSTRIIRNDSCGVSIEGSSQPVIGDAADATCSFYGNGVYDVSNNTVNAIAARYNYWAQADSLGIEDRVYHCADDAAKGCVLFVPWSDVQRDVAVLEIVEPSGTLDIGSEATPRALIKNGGVSPETFPVVFMIGGFYSDTVTVTSLGSGDTAEVIFAVWPADSVGTHSVLCYTSLDGDEFPENDTASDSIFVFSNEHPILSWPDPAEAIPGVTPDTGIAQTSFEFAVVYSDTDGDPPLRFGIALHVGEVAYGNIGAPDRLDFTVVGPAVNVAARLEALCKSLDRPLLVSEAFAACAGPCRRRLRSLGVHTLRGVRRPQEVFTLPEAAFDAAA